MPLQFNPSSKTIASSGWGGVGPVLVSGLSKKQRTRVLQIALDHAESLGRELGAEQLEFWLSPVTLTSLNSKWGVNPYVFFGFEDNSGLSQVIDLSKTENELWKDVSETTRHAIAKAQKAGFVVEETSWPEAVDDYYAMHCETYRRTGVSPHPKTYFEGIAREMWPKGHSVLWAVRNVEGRTLAYHNAVWFRESAFYHTGCSTAAALQEGVNYLLFWHALLTAKYKGIRWYDCGEIAPGAVGKRQGLTTFKTKFGGEPHRFFKCSKNLSKEGFEEGSSSSRASLRSLWQRLLLTPKQ